MTGENNSDLENNLLILNALKDLAGPRSLGHLKALTRDRCILFICNINLIPCFT